MAARCVGPLLSELWAAALADDSAEDAARQRAALLSEVLPTPAAWDCAVLRPTLPGRCHSATHQRARTRPAACEPSVPKH